jgi:O-antigen/teichoic acid export membrane protein
MTLPKTNPLFCDAFGTLVVRMFGIVLIFGSTTVLARLLGPTEYGAYSAALAMTLLLAALAPLGSDRILTRNLATAKTTEESGRETARAHLCTGITTVVFLPALLVASAVLRYGLHNQSLARTSLLTAIMLVPLTAVFLRQWIAIPLIGSRRAVIPEQTLLPFAFTVGMLLIAAAGWKSGATTAASMYAMIMVLVWFGSLQTKEIRVVYCSAWTAVSKISRSEIGRLLHEGLPFVSVSIGSILTQTCMPLVIAATCGLEATAYFALAFPYAALPTLPLGAFNLTMISRCARHYQLGEFAEAQHAVRSAATITFLLSAVISIAIWIGSPLLPMLLGAEYHMVSRLLPALFLGVIVDCLTGPTIPVMQTMKMEKTYSQALFAFIPIQWSLVYWFGNFAGVEGTALAYLSSRCLWNVIVVATIYKRRGLVMLPYLSFRKALGEFSPPPELESRRYRTKQSLWANMTTTDTSVAPARAA